MAITAAKAEEAKEADEAATEGAAEAEEAATEEAEDAAGADEAEAGADEEADEAAEEGADEEAEEATAAADEAAEEAEGAEGAEAEAATRVPEKGEVPLRVCCSNWSTTSKVTRHAAASVMWSTVFFRSSVFKRRRVSTGRKVEVRD